MKTKAIILVLVLFAVSCLLSAVCCSAAVPSLINYQGVLKDSTGVPYDGNATMVFSIWDDSTDGNKLWEETQAIVSVSHGLFNVLLGSSEAIPDSVFDQPSAWLDVLVNGSRLSPRRQIVSVGYALHSGFTDTAEYALSAPPDDDWDIDTAGFNVYRLTGGVGIGTPSPQEKLEVNGNAHITGDLNVDGTINPFPLRVYDSGWFAVSANSTYTKTHSLGTTKVLTSLYVAQNSDGSGFCLFLGINFKDGTTEQWRQTQMVSLSTTQIQIRTGDHHLSVFKDINGNEIRPTSGYCRIIMLALE